MKLIKRIVLMFIAVGMFFMLNNVSAYKYITEAESYLKIDSQGKLISNANTRINLNDAETDMVGNEALEAFFGQRMSVSEHKDTLVRENIMTLDDNVYGLWMYVFRLNECIAEIEKRLETDKNDKEDLELYIDVLGGNTLPVNYKDKNDPLYRVAMYNDAGPITIKSQLEGTYNNSKGMIRNEIVIKCIEGVLQKSQNTVQKVKQKLSAIEANSQQQQQQQPVVERDEKPLGSGDWWKDAQSFFKTGKDKGQNVDNATKGLVDELGKLIFEIGNMIFIIVTSILGVKYIFGSAEGKAQVKDSLITLIIAALFFYGWSAIDKLLNIGGLLADGSLMTTASKIYNTILFIINLLAVSGVIWIGVKYMLSSAQGRAEIKTSWGPLILGVVMVYGTIWFLTTIIKVVLGG